jgi:hypothetical protein
VLRQYTASHLLLGQQALANGDAAGALRHFAAAMDTPSNLGEAYHLLQAKADVNYWLGRAYRALGHEAEAVRHFEAAAAETGDLADMAVTAHSPLSFYRGQALRELGRTGEAAALFTDLRAFATDRLHRPARIDYFATSLPDLLVFEEDLQARRDAENHLLLALAAHAFGESAVAATHLEKVRAFSNSDLRAADLARELGAKTMQKA